MGSITRTPLHLQSSSQLKIASPWIHTSSTSRTAVVEDSLNLLSRKQRDFASEHLERHGSSYCWHQRGICAWLMLASTKQGYNEPSLQVGSRQLLRHSARENSWQWHGVLDFRNLVALLYSFGSIQISCSYSVQLETSLMPVLTSEAYLASSSRDSENKVR